MVIFDRIDKLLLNSNIVSGDNILTVLIILILSREKETFDRNEDQIKIDFLSVFFSVEHLGNSIMIASSSFSIPHKDPKKNLSDRL